MLVLVVLTILSLKAKAEGLLRVDFDSVNTTNPTEMAVLFATNALTSRASPVHDKVHALLRDLDLPFNRYIPWWTWPRAGMSYHQKYTQKHKHTNRPKTQKIKQKKSLCMK